MKTFLLLILLLILGCGGEPEVKEAKSYNLFDIRDIHKDVKILNDSSGLVTAEITTVGSYIRDSVCLNDNYEYREWRENPNYNGYYMDEKVKYIVYRILPIDISVDTTCYEEKVCEK